MTPITDPAIINQLEGASSHGPITDPDLLSKLEAPPDVGHNLAVVGSGLIRGIPALPLGIVDTAARIPTWAANTATGSVLPYPPSANAAYQDYVNKNLDLAKPQDTFEDYIDSTLKGISGGPAGTAGALAARTAQNIPVSDENLKIGNRDLGISPKDITTTVAGLVGGGVATPKTLTLGRPSFPDSPQAYLASKLMEQNVPVALSDVMPDGALRGAVQWLGNAPLSGLSGRLEKQQAAATQAATGNIGVPSDSLTTKTMQTAKGNAGGVFNDVGKYASIPEQGVNSLFDSLMKVQQEAKSFGPLAQAKVNNVIEHDFLPRVDQNGELGGVDYNSLRHGFNKMSMNSDSEVRDAGGQMAHALNRTMMQALPDDKAQQLGEALSNYRGMHALEPAVKADMGTGNVDASKLQSGADRVYGNYEYNDPASLSQLAQGMQLLTRPQNPAQDFLKANYGSDISGVANAAKDIGSAATLGIPYRLMNPQLSPSDLQGLSKAQILAKFLSAQGVNSAVQSAQ